MLSGPRLRPPGRRTARAVVATTAEVLDRGGLDEGALAPWERRRLAKVRVPDRRDDVLAARLLLRLCAARLTGWPPRELVPVQFCADCGRHGHGRPFLRDHPEVGISLSHADGLVAAAAGPGAVGVDVEPAGRRVGPPPMWARLLGEAGLRDAAARPDPGRAVLRQWVRGEALFKAGHRTGPLLPRPPGLPWADGPGSHPSRLDGLYVLDWTDERRAAVVTAVAAAPVRLLSAASLLTQSAPRAPHTPRAPRALHETM
ncbi:hypothetical protein [Streptomyces sp. NPDC101181]|uniref:hypothetical protein n=1 Tax=Streptomyces sp. NPDC101181 TaxID=3366125 RepID=UPI0038015542